jgi:hypothetical protein
VLVDIAQDMHYVFSKTCIKWWTAIEICNVKLLFQTREVLLEDRDGPKARPLEHAARAGHVLEDVL